MTGLLFWKNKSLGVKFEEVQRRFLSDRRVKVIPRRGTKDRKGAGFDVGWLSVALRPQKP